MTEKVKTYILKKTSKKINMAGTGFDLEETYAEAPTLKEVQILFNTKPKVLNTK